MLGLVRHLCLLTPIKTYFSKVNKMSENHWLPFDGATGRVATQCEISYKPTHSKLLDASGKPMAYKQHPVGFDLTPSKQDH